MTLDPAHLSMREAMRLHEEEQAAIELAEYQAQRESEAVATEEIRWERIMRQAAAEREPVHYREDKPGVDSRMFGP